MNNNYTKLGVLIAVSLVVSSAAIISLTPLLLQQLANASLSGKNNQGSAQSNITGNNEYLLWSDILSRIKITSLNKTNGQDTILTPTYQLTQTTLTGQPHWRIFYYISKENPQQLDVKAVMGITNANNGGYIIEIGKLTQQGIRIDIDNGSRTLIIPASKLNQVGPGFVSFVIQGNNLGGHGVPYLP
jgi:hypothetical protein